jgi:hypothetical protein
MLWKKRSYSSNPDHILLVKPRSDGEGQKFYLMISSGNARCGDESSRQAATLVEFGGLV